MVYTIKIVKMRRKKKRTRIKIRSMVQSLLVSITISIRSKITWIKMISRYCPKRSY